MASSGEYLYPVQFIVIVSKKERFGETALMFSCFVRTSSDSSSYSTSTNTTFTPDITISTLSSGSAT